VKVVKDLVVESVWASRDFEHKKAMQPAKKFFNIVMVL
jgi:hypothetical protein